MKGSVSAVALATAMFMYAGYAMADGPQAEVMHWWVSAGESAAVKEIAKAYTAQGGVWKDNAIAGGEVAIANIVSRITGGNPPTAAQMPLGKQLDDLVAQGLLSPIDDAAKETGFYDNIPETFQKAMTFPDGHMYALPINDHGHNWLWYNKKVLADAGAKEPVTWDDFFAALDAIKAKGNATPIAVGAQPWQLGQTFLSVLLTKEGPGLFNKVFADLDLDAVKSPEFKDAVATFLKLRDYSDNGAANREWNVAANMVITGKAGFQFMGDWAKGEFLAAGQKPDVDFGCQILGNGDGKQYFNVSSDAIIFPVNKAADQAKAQTMLERIMMSKDVQVAFNSKKGSVPARLDVDASKLDACAAKGIKILQDPAQRIPSLDFLVSPDTIGAERDLAAQAWADPKYTPDQFVESLTKIIEAEKTMR
ncbi:ABC transporter substrate-binding protein [Rhizobium sp. AG207R]|uniref:ABC transporter substrate-binding protein n=1 Tax=Rhizobium sp. AG207R TaxID=2802287 RepID=UPI0022AC37D2|nr:ABC transporter substrate-binding protein [Rhizobium sp. AG207R]MCZ3374332.1 carbohydrate ABC transporter substrate-binding protein [Rhizobium sp. AG207R]